MKPILTMLVGVAGSGKSTVAKQIAQKSGAHIHSSDAIRAEIYGDENCHASVCIGLFDRPRLCGGHLSSHLGGTRLGGSDVCRRFCSLAGAAEDPRCKPVSHLRRTLCFIGF